MKKLTYLICRSFLLLLCIMMFSQCADETESYKDINTVNPTEFKGLIDSLSTAMKSNTELTAIQLVDVRTPEEWKQGTLNEAFKINYRSDSFEKEIEQLDKSQPVFVYCASGNRSKKASKVFIDAGFNTVYNLNGGYRDLIKNRPE